MKLADLNKYLTEVDHEDRGEAPPTSGSGTISTKQAAKILGVAVSRVRQLIADGKLKPTIKPREGDRDHELLEKDVRALAAKRSGRKKGESEEKSEKSEKSDED